MFSDLNPQGSTTAMIEIAIMLTGAFLIGLIFAWLFHRARASAKKEKTDESATGIKGQFIKAKKLWEGEKLGLQQKIQHLEQQVQAKIQPQVAPVQEANPALKSELEAAKKRAAELEWDLTTLKQELQKLKTNHSETETAHNQAKDRASALQTEIDTLKADLLALKNTASLAPSPEMEKQIANLQSDLKHEKSRAENLMQSLEAEKNAKQQLQQDLSMAGIELERVKKALEAAQESLSKQPAKSPEEAPKATEIPAEVAEWRKQAEEKAQEAEQLRLRMRELQDKAASSGLGNEAVAQLREKLKAAEGESESLKEKLKALEAKVEQTQTPPVQEESLNKRIIHKLTTERDQLRKELEELRAAPSLVAADDLTKIPGITHEIQQKLYAQGIRTYAALSQLSELDRIRLDRELGLGVGTFKEMKWVKKAKELLKQS